MSCASLQLLYQSSTIHTHPNTLARNVAEPRPAFDLDLAVTQPGRISSGILCYVTGMVCAVLCAGIRHNDE